MPVSVQLDIEDSEVAYLLCSAIESGIHYWCKEVQHAYLTNNPPAKPWGDEYTPEYIAAPFTEGGSIVVHLRREKDDPDNLKDTYAVDRAVMAQGLKVMATKAPRHFANFMADNADAETGDVFLQCCIFGEIVFG